MIGYIAALLYGALTFLFIVVLGLQIGSPIVVFWVVLAAASAYLCQVTQVTSPNAWPVWGTAWLMSLFFTVVAIIAAGGKIIG